MRTTPEQRKMLEVMVVDPVGDITKYEVDAIIAASADLATLEELETTVAQLRKANAELYISDTAWQATEIENLKNRLEELEDNCDNLNAEWQAAVERENRLLHRIAETRSAALDEAVRLARNMAEPWNLPETQQSREIIASIAAAIEKLKEVMPNNPKQCPEFTTAPRE